MILQYVWDTFHFGIYYSSGGTPLLVGLIDSNWVGDPNDKNPTISYVFILGSRPITWSCKKQQVVDIYLVEEEY
jgi:hypothetical protein